MEQHPKILIVSRLNWNDNSNSNTLTNLFDGYDANKIARIYIETATPNTKCCHLFYQISEVALIRRIFRWNIKTGKVIKTNDEKRHLETKHKDEAREQSIMSFARHHRFFLFKVMRDMLWALNGWKSKELKTFITEFNPDIVWLDGSPLILMNRLNNYVAKVAGVKSCTFLMDDVYTYKSCTGVLSKVYRYFLRKQVKKTVYRASHVFVASEKMKREYDKIFSVNSTFVAKGITNFISATKATNIGKPIKMVYLGNVLIGRLDSLICLSETIHRINEENGQPMYTLSIYTGDFISKKDKKKLMLDNSILLYPPVPYEEINNIIANNDIVVFVESLEPRRTRIARLSFSTKIVDYMGSGKCILTIGPAESAPVEYLRDNDISIVASSKEAVYEVLNSISPSDLEDYAAKAIVFASEKHNKAKTQKHIYNILQRINE